MPKPQRGEKRDDFINRCIPIVIDEGTVNNSDQAAAICFSIWEQKTEDKAVSEFLNDLLKSIENFKKIKE